MSVHTTARRIKSIEGFFEKLYHSFSGIAKVLILSKFNLALPKARGQECIVLGNGPSLAKTIQKYSDRLKSTPLVCVNNFATSKEFREFKPAHYIVLDPGFFIYKERPDIVATFNELKHHVDWEMDFFVPYLFRKDSHLLEVAECNDNVRIKYYNYTIISGFCWLTNFLYKRNLAMPQFFNIMGAAIFVSINLGYKTVYLTGTDHSWFLELYIGNDNALSRKDYHFYDKEGVDQPLIPLIDPVSKKVQRIGDFFEAMHKVFNSYYILDRYAAYRNCKVYNASEFSYIDAFERKPLSE